MRDRDLLDVALRFALCVAVVATYALVRDAERAASATPPRPDLASADRRFRLSEMRRSRRAPEDRCTSCAGFGFTSDAAHFCSRCHGRGVEPHDATLVRKLDALWSGIA